VCVLGLVTIILFLLACSFWMIYGGVKFDKSVDEDTLCKDVDAVDFNQENNCTVVAITAFSRFDLTAYALYVVTFGGGVDEVF
jgi:hypothetical protein